MRGPMCSMNMPNSYFETGSAVFCVSMVTISGFGTPTGLADLRLQTCFPTTTLRRRKVRLVVSLGPPAFSLVTVSLWH